MKRAAPTWVQLLVVLGVAAIATAAVVALVLAFHVSFSRRDSLSYWC